MANMIIMKLLRSKIHKKMLKNIRVTRKCDTFLGMDKLVFIFKGNQNLLKQRCVSRALPPSVLAVLGLKCIATSAEKTWLLFVNVIQKF
jgi:hypothetical protein